MWLQKSTGEIGGLSWALKLLINRGQGLLNVQEITKQAGGGCSADCNASTPNPPRQIPSEPLCPGWLTSIGGWGAAGAYLGKSAQLSREQHKWQQHFPLRAINWSSARAELAALPAALQAQTSPPGPLQAQRPLLMHTLISSFCSCKIMLLLLHQCRDGDETWSARPRSKMFKMPLQSQELGCWDSPVCSTEL